MGWQRARARVERVAVKHRVVDSIQEWLQLLQPINAACPIAVVNVG